MEMRFSQCSGTLVQCVARRMRWCSGNLKRREPSAGSSDGTSSLISPTVSAQPKTLNVHSGAGGFESRREKSRDGHQRRRIPRWARQRDRPVECTTKPRASHSTTTTSTIAPLNNNTPAKMLYLLDYGAGSESFTQPSRRVQGSRRHSPFVASRTDVRSLANSIRKLGYDFEWVKSPQDLDKADVSQNRRRNLAKFTHLRS